MQNYCIQSYIDRYFNEDNVFGMTRAKLKTMDEDFKIIDKRQEDGKFLIDEFITGL